MFIFDLWTLVLGSKKYYLQEPQNHFPIREHSPKLGGSITVSQSRTQHPDVQGLVKDHLAKDHSAKYHSAKVHSLTL